jgi:two-component system chemotaxis response regulator CheY
MRAIVIDDSKTIRVILKKILEDIGFEVYEACHGREALDCLQKVGPVDLALVDWNMPEMDGFEFVCTVRSQPTYDPLCLLMVTTETNMEQVAKAIEAGANEYVMKPFTKDIILEKLDLLGISQRSLRPGSTFEDV